MATKLEQEAYLYRRAIDIIDSPDTDSVKEELLFEEVWLPLAALYKERLRQPNSTRSPGDGLTGARPGASRYRPSAWSVGNRAKFSLLRQAMGFGDFDRG
jgi:hypothetical protein